jgi:hypothetical protein
VIDGYIIHFIHNFSNGGDECARFLERKLPVAIVHGLSSVLDKSFNIFETISEKMKIVFVKAKD